MKTDFTKIGKEMAAIRGWDSDSDRNAILRKAAESLGYTEEITGDACQGDEIVFARAIFSGSYKKARFAGIEVIEGMIVADSYGRHKQQHTFTIQRSDGEKLLIKGRNLYSIGVFAKPRDRSERAICLNDKHDRGDEASYRRNARRNAQPLY